jgi:hypothetical protein
VTLADGSVQALKQKLAEFNQEHIFNFAPNITPESQLFKQVRNNIFSNIFMMFIFSLLFCLFAIYIIVERC